MSIVDLLHTYLDAREALHTANAGSDQKLGVIHKGTMYLVQMGKDGIAGMAIGPNSDEAPPLVGVDVAAGDDKAVVKKRGRPAKVAEAPIAGPGSTPTAPTDVTNEAPPAAPAAPPMPKDKFRAAARDIAAVIGIEPTKKIIGCPIDELPADQYADRLAKLEAARKETL